MSLAAYAFSGSPPKYEFIICPFCGESTYAPGSPWIRKEIRDLGCGSCEQSVKGDERFEAIGNINEEENP